MQYLLTIILSFYPTLFLYASVPAVWMKWVDGIIPTGKGFFFVHLALFAVIFFLVYKVLSRFISLGYFINTGRGLMRIVLMTIFMLALAVIAFYNLLPGNIIYDSPSYIDAYLLKNPYTFLALIAPFLYLFFD